MLLSKMFYFSWWKTMKSAWEPATELLNKDNFGPCRHIRLTSECSIWAKRNREKWSWSRSRSHYLFFLPDLHWRHGVIRLWNFSLESFLSWISSTQKEYFSISSLKLTPVGGLCMFIDMSLLGAKVSSLKNNMPSPTIILPFMTCKVWSPRSFNPSSESGPWSSSISKKCSLTGLSLCSA